MAATGSSRPGILRPGMATPGSGGGATIVVSDTGAIDDNRISIPGALSDTATGADVAAVAQLIAAADTSGTAVDSGHAFNIAAVTDAVTASEGASVTAYLADTDTGAGVDAAQFGYIGVVPRVGRVARAQAENRTMVIPAEIDGVAA